MCNLIRIITYLFQFIKCLELIIDGVAILFLYSHCYSANNNTAELFEWWVLCEDGFLLVLFIYSLFKGAYTCIKVTYICGIFLKWLFTISNKECRYVKLFVILKLSNHNEYKRLQCKIRVIATNMYILIIKHLCTNNHNQTYCRFSVRQSESWTAVAHENVFIWRQYKQDHLSTNAVLTTVTYAVHLLLALM